MPNHREAAERFLSLRRIAVVGVSRAQKDFSRVVYRALAAAGHEVVPVNPGAEEIEGSRCFARLADVTPPVEGAVVMVAIARAEEVVRDARAAGVKNLWLHHGFGAGASSPAVLAMCASWGIAAVDGLCPLMALSQSTWLHRLQGHLPSEALERQDTRELRLRPRAAGAP